MTIAVPPSISLVYYLNDVCRYNNIILRGIVHGLTTWNAHTKNTTTAMFCNCLDSRNRTLLCAKVENGMHHMYYVYSKDQKLMGVAK